MKMVRWNHPFAPSFSRIVDDMFNDNFFRTTGVDHTNTIPKVNVTEDNDRFLLDVAAPGLDKGDFKISLDKNVLTIKAAKEAKTEDKTEGKVTRREFSYSTFERAFTLPKSVKAEGIEAAYENGILSITLPKREEAKVLPAREIEIG